jgi:hypothetical protein
VALFRSLVYFQLSNWEFAPEDLQSLSALSTPITEIELVDCNYAESQNTTDPSPIHMKYLTIRNSKSSRGTQATERLLAMCLKSTHLRELTITDLDLRKLAEVISRFQTTMEQLTTFRALACRLGLPGPGVLTGFDELSEAIPILRSVEKFEVTGGRLDWANSAMGVLPVGTYPNLKSLTCDPDAVQFLALQDRPTDLVLTRSAGSAAKFRDSLRMNRPFYSSLERLTLRLTHLLWQPDLFEQLVRVCGNLQVLDIMTNSGRRWSQGYDAGDFGDITARMASHCT